MAETKTFDSKKDAGSLQYAHGAYYYGGNEFLTDEWDMKVTFTKKVKPVEAGQWRETGRNGAEVCVYVLAIYGKVAWVTDDPEWLEEGKLNAWTEPLDKLR